MNVTTGKIVTPKKILLMSVLLGFFADIKCVNAFLVAINPSFEGTVMSILYAITVSLLLIVGMQSGFKKSINSKTLLIPIYCLILYIITIFLGEKPRVAFVFFCVFTLASFFIPLFIKIDVRLFLKATMFFSIFSLLKIREIFVFTYDYNEVISMGSSYAYLIPVLATIVYMAYYFKEEKGFQKILTVFLTICNSVFLFYLFAYGSRGPIISIALFAFFFFVIKKNTNKGVTFSTKSIVFGLITIILLFVLFVPAIQWLMSIGVNSYSLQKILFLFEEGDISNGRNSLAQLAWDGFAESPLWGHGMDLFGNRYSDASYPHNFILQILYDGGIIFFFILLVPFFTRIKIVLTNCDYNTFVIFLFLFCVSVPGALFSGDLWENNLLWLFFGFLFSNNIVLKNAI